MSALGASTKGNVLLQLANLDETKLDRVFDVNREKFGKFTPITKIKIENEGKINKFNQDYLLILIWHFKKYIIDKLQKKNKKTKLIIPFPKIMLAVILLTIISKFFKCSNRKSFINFIS